MTEEEKLARQEYLDTRKIYIEGSRNASDKFHTAIITLSSAGFVYAQNVTSENKLFIYVYICFAIAVISSIMVYYCSGEAHMKQLDIYDEEHELDVTQKKCSFCFKKMQTELDFYNNILDGAEKLALVAVIGGILFSVISFLI